MGKAVKKARAKQQRQNMTGLPTVASMEAEAAANEPLVDDGPRVPLLDKIDDPVPAHRSAAFQALSNLVIDDPETKQTLSKKHNLKKVLAHVCDPELEVRVAAVGALRNMTQFGEPSTSDELIKNDIFTPLVAVIQQALSDTNANVDLVNQLLCQSVALLMNLCENSEKALELFSASKILPFFAQFLQPTKYPYDLVITTGQFFFVITDNNTRAQQELLAIPGYSTAVAALIQDPSIPIRVRTLLAGIDATTFNTHRHVWEVLFNSLNCDYSVESQKLFAKLATMEGEVVVRAIHSNDAILVDEFSTPAEKQAKKERRQNRLMGKVDDEAMVDEEESSAAKQEQESRVNAAADELRKELDAFQESIQAQKLALEVLTNICSDECIEEAETMDDDEGEDEDENGEYQQPASKADVPQTPELAARSALLWSSGFFSLVLRLAYPIQPLNTQNNRALEGSEWAHNTAKCLQEVQVRAVSCLGNIVLDAGAKTSINDPSKPWDCLVAVCAQNAQNIPLLESATNAMWTLLRLFSANGAKALVPSMENVSGIMQLARAPSAEYVNLRSTALGMLGVIAQLPQTKPALTEIGRVFLEALSSQSAICIAEALNSIFDVFAETTNNDVVRSLEMMKILRGYLPMLKLKVKGERKVLSRDVWDRLDESKLNLIGFLKYKKNQ